MDAPHVYVRAWALGCLSYQYPNLSGGADRVAKQLRGDKECSFSGVTKSVWQSLEEGAGKRCSECGVRYRFGIRWGLWRGAQGCDQRVVIGGCDQRVVIEGCDQRGGDKGGGCDQKGGDRGL